MIAAALLVVLTELPPELVGVHAYLVPAQNDSYSTSDIVVVHPHSAKQIKVTSESGYEDTLWTYGCQWSEFYLHEEVRRATVEVTIYEAKTPAFQVVGQKHGHHSISAWYVMLDVPEITWYRVVSRLEVGE